MTRDELKELARTEPGVQSAFAEVRAEFKKTMDHATALWGKHSELSAQLQSIASAKAELAKPVDDKPAVAEPAKPADATAKK